MAERQTAAGTDQHHPLREDTVLKFSSLSKPHSSPKYKFLQVPPEPPLDSLAPGERVSHKVTSSPALSAGKVFA